MTLMLALVVAGLRVGPIVSAQAPKSPGRETRIQRAAILDHPIAAVALEYVDLLHNGRIDEAIARLTTRAGQAAWNAQPPKERVEDAEFRQRLLPKRADLLAGIQAGGILIIEDDTRATLNVIHSESRSSSRGTATSSSTTIALGFTREDDQWKVTR